jgi:hypothetical protein
VNSYLPFNQGIRHGAPGLVEHAAAHDDALAQRLARMLPGEVGFRRRDVGMAVDRAGDLRQRLRNENQRARWRAQHG